ncbi:MAG TPA: hypothetical protein VGR00_05195, partial [Thermoanaerobaculia bacterium]|nr:hypothetical protein [Thermoanaerobaculia bacterium]
LNGRFLAARKRWPALEGEPFGNLVGSLLSPFESTGRADLFSELFDIALLHSGRDALATHPGLATLLHESFPRLSPWLLREPTLAGALSNALENLQKIGRNGESFAREIAAIGAVVESPEQLLAAAALLSWRLGEARLQDAVLERAKALPKRAVLLALDLQDWPAAAAPLAIAALESDAWTPPRLAFKPETIARLASAPPAEIESLARHLVAAGDSAPPEDARWKVAARLGDFSGFGGAGAVFDTPPVVLDGGSPHLLHARSGGRSFVLFADVYGCVAREGPEVAAPIEKRPALPFPPPLGATSYAVFPQAIVVAFRDSHRLSVYIPERARL